MSSFTRVIMNKSIEEILRAIPSAIGRDLFTEICHAEWNVPSTRTIETLGIALGTHPGSRRPRNEDRAVVAHVTSVSGERFTVALVCDGVGGSEMGDMAATVAVATCIADLAETQHTIRLNSLLPRLIRNMDDAVRRALNGKGATTVSILLTSSTGDIASANIGDSRVFSWTKGERSFQQVSVDDTLENELRNIPGKDLSALNARGIQGSLSQALGEIGRSASDLRVVVFGRNNFSQGVVLASDGAWKAATDGFNATALNAPSALDLVRRVITSALWTGGVDNVSVIAIQDIEQLMRSPAEASPLNYGRSRITAWFADTKVVIRDIYERQGIDQNLPRQDVKPENAVPQVEKKDRRKPAGRNKRSRVDSTNPSPELDLRAAEDNPRGESQADAKPKIVVSTDDEPLKPG
jgi:serine/threonine protein phosphatase PrpC